MNYIDEMVSSFENQHLYFSKDFLTSSNVNSIGFFYQQKFIKPSYAWLEIKVTKKMHLKTYIKNSHMKSNKCTIMHKRNEDEKLQSCSE